MMMDPKDATRKTGDKNPDLPIENIPDEVDEWPDANGEMPLSFYLAQQDPKKYKGQDI
jgi:hypothetical protein